MACEDVTDVTATVDDDLAALFRLHYGRMVTLAWLLVRSTPLAEDIVQDSFLKLREAWDRVDNPVAYLRTIVVNGCRKARRRAGTERLHQHASAGEKGAVSTDHVDETLELLARLPTAQRTVLVLRYYVDLPTDEIAAILGCRPATVRSHAHRGLAALKGVLG